MQVPLTKPSKILIKRDSRRNLPIEFARKYAERNFVLAFGRAYCSQVERNLKSAVFSAGREVPVFGFGVADFVWVAWKNPSDRREGTALASKKNPEAEIIAFEMKLRDWSRGLAQATRYRFFADASFLVLPPAQAKIAFQRKSLFAAAGVGLISFEVSSLKIEVLLQPKRSKPLSQKARAAIIQTFRSIKPITTDH